MNLRPIQIDKTKHKRAGKLNNISILFTGMQYLVRHVLNRPWSLHVSKFELNDEEVG